MRKRIFEVIEVAEIEDLPSKIYDTAMMVVIIASLVPLAFKEAYEVFHLIDLVCVTIFIIDYILRLATADYKFGKKSLWSFIRYPFSFMAIIDLVSILPSISLFGIGFGTAAIARTLKALRVVRAFKALRYSKSVKIIASVFKHSKGPLLAVGVLSGCYILVSALVIFNVEPDSFDNFFEAIYWATVSLTTVGYGDIYPVTNIGRIITMVSSMFGIAIVALPSGIVTAGYINELQKDIPEEHKIDPEVFLDGRKHTIATKAAKHAKKKHKKN